MRFGEGVGRRLAAFSLIIPLSGIPVVYGQTVRPAGTLSGRIFLSDGLTPRGGVVVKVANLTTSQVFNSGEQFFFIGDSFRPNEITKSLWLEQSRDRLQFSPPHILRGGVALPPKAARHTVRGCAKIAQTVNDCQVETLCGKS